MYTASSQLYRLCATILLLALAAFSFVGPAQADSNKIEFNRDIRPILSDKCFYCHGPDKNHRKGKLRLDQREDALAKKAIIPGKPTESELIARIFSTDKDELMPPPDAHKALTPAQKETLKKWVEQGAEYQAHWSYIIPQRTTVPVVTNPKWLRNNVDAFILARLEAAKLQPSEEADRRTLLRRLSLDLTGLPPTPAEVDAFLKDKSPQAYEKQVERLMQSSHYGERMAVPWLDAVRFTDTVGYHGDQNQNIFPYRDYVIASFNNNKPFDQFTIEQLAGDLLPKPTAEQIVATGFNRLNMMTREGGAQPKEYLAKYAADRVRTVGNAWLGSTLNCSECHDHKFDPFTTKDFYSMAAFFADVKQWGVYSYYNYTPTPELKGFNNEYPFPPEMEIESPYLKTRSEYLRLRMEDTAKMAVTELAKNKVTKQSFSSWKQESAQWLAANPSGWLTPPVQVLTDNRAKANEKNKKKAEKMTDLVTATNAMVKEDKIIVFTGKQTSGDKFELTLPEGKYASLRLELVPTAESRRSILRDNATSATIKLKLSLKHKGAAKPETITFDHGMADQADVRYASGSEIVGVRDAWKVGSGDLKTTHTAAWQFKSPITAQAGDTLTITLEDNAFGGLRWSLSPFASVNPLQPELAEKLTALLSAKATDKSADAKWFQQLFLLSSQADTNAVKELRDLRNQYLECRDGKAFSLITVAWEPTTTRILPRGNWQDESGAVVTPAPPQFLSTPQTSADHRLTRLDLARWLVSKENPLTSRVIVNRLWKQFFGNGLCNSVEDLGAQGEWPSHPELLDWLAVEFRESGWDYKHMVRLMVTSAAYRQSSNLKPAVIEADPENRLLASQNPRRLEAEFVRDNALSAAGILNLDLGGPSVYPYQPEGYYESLQFPDRDYIANKDDRQYRRGVYMHWQRTFLHPMLANFDAPSREECTGLRTVSNTPQQALTLLNDPSFVEAARVLAETLISSSKNDSKRLDLAYQRCLARLPKEAERKSLMNLLKGQKTYYQENTEEAEKLLKVGNATRNPALSAPEHAAWTSVCRVILNLHETITRY
jgi:hypothetical protein